MIKHSYKKHATQSQSCMQRMSQEGGVRFMESTKGEKRLKSKFIIEFRHQEMRLWILAQRQNFFWLPMRNSKFSPQTGKNVVNEKNVSRQKNVAWLPGGLIT